MKKTIFLILGLLSTIAATSQIQLTQYYMDGTLYNPAMAGSKGAICSGLSGRQQWMNFTDPLGNHVSPRSIVFNISSPLYSINSGVGLNIIYDEAAFETNTGFKLNYVYRIPLQNEKNHLGLGIGLSVLNKVIRFDQLITEQQGDPLLKLNDRESGIIPDLDFGIIYQNAEKFNIAVSAVNLMESSAEIGNVRTGNNRQFYLLTDYRIKLSDSRRQSLVLIPSLFLKTNTQNSQMDISTRVEFNNRYWGGLSYRYQDAIAIIGGLNINGFRIGASYDISIGKLSVATPGSMEIFLGYCYSITPKVKLNSLYNTRYL